MKKVSELVEGDYIAFGFNYNGGEPKEIMVSNITSIRNEQVLVHFLYGHHSLGEWVPFDQIIGIGNVDGITKINGWGGKFDLLLPDHELLKETI